MKQNNIIVDKSKLFAIRIVRLYKYLCNDKKEYVISKQVLRSGTSIGANVKESVYAQNQFDFVSKLSIALEKSSETEYWLELLFQMEYITSKQFESIHNDCVELIKLLTSIINSSKSNNY